jgi:hypothetical protein
MESRHLFQAALWGEIGLLIARAGFFAPHQLLAAAVMLLLAISIFLFRKKLFNFFSENPKGRALYMAAAAAFLLFAAWVFIRAFECYQNPIYRYGPHYNGDWPLGDAGIPNWGMALLLFAFPVRLLGLAWCLEKMESSRRIPKTGIIAAAGLAVIFLPVFKVLFGPIIIAGMLAIGWGYGFGISI